MTLKPWHPKPSASPDYWSQPYPVSPAMLVAIKEAMSRPLYEVRK